MYIYWKIYEVRGVKMDSEEYGCYDDIEYDFIGEDEEWE